MCTSSSIPPTSLPYLLTHPNFLSSPKPPLTYPLTFLTHYSLRHPTPLRFPSTISHTSSSHLSWDSHHDPTPSDDYNGWAIPQPPIIPHNKKRGLSTFLVAGVGTSIAVLAVVLSRFSLSKNGFRLPFRSSIRSSTPGSSVEIAVEIAETKAIDSDESAVEDIEVTEKSEEVDFSDVVTKTMAEENCLSRVVNVAVDSNQQEAVHVLKKLKVLDEDVKANELCTRREYARWLVRASSLLERNPKYKVTTTVALAGSVISAYEDVATGDPDFESIQALAEAGVLPSKLSSKHRFDGGLNFAPERFLSRRDLIEWKSQLEYNFAATGNQEILKTKLDLMDVGEISSDEWPGLFMDMLAGDKSLLRRVFGQIRRLQPNKPSTIAQAAVALSSGRMIEAIQNELLRIQSEESSRKAAEEEIKQELLDRGEIERYWAGILEEEKKRGLEVQQLYLDALTYLEQERIVHEGALNGFLKEKAAMDCQKQLLESLKVEVNEISERLVSERTELIYEEATTQSLRSDMETKKEGILDAKSLLEAEIEALRILRSWIEDEARKSKARSKVLEEVGKRWKWDRQY